MSFIQCHDNTGSKPSAVFVNLNLIETIHTELVPGSELYNVKIKVGGVEYDMFDEPVDKEKASNAILQVTGLKGK